MRSTVGRWTRRQARRHHRSLARKPRGADAIHGNCVAVRNDRSSRDCGNQLHRGSFGAVRATDRDKRIVDGHGDLLADDIFCVPDGPLLLDCLEFDDHLRYVDGIDDAAFLAMDLEFLGRKDLADYFFDTYCEFADDEAPASLKHFYIAYRAVVRAKVDCVRFTQGDPEASANASRHLSLALEHLNAGAVRLALIGGAPGTGKTTLARALADRVGAEVISTDDVRRELKQAGTIDGEAGVLDVGLYIPERWPPSTATSFAVHSSPWPADGR